MGENTRRANVEDCLILLMPVTWRSGICQVRWGYQAYGVVIVVNGYQCILDKCLSRSGLFLKLRFPSEPLDNLHRSLLTELTSDIVIKLNPEIAVHADLCNFRGYA